MQIDCSLTTPVSPIADIEGELLMALPTLRAYAISLCGRSERADDLVQETAVKALANMSSFLPGSNLMAWLYTILRNEFYSEYRKRRREVEDDEGHYAAKMECRPDQEGHMRFLDLRDALDRLAPDHRKALILVGAAGHSYDDAATLCGCAVGTMKSRVNRARGKLAELLGAPAGHRPEPGLCLL